MNSYIMNFAIYTFAMIGFIVIALYIYKKSMYSVNDSKNREFLTVENSLKLSATKTIYVIKAGSEKFLIAGDASNTTMLSKLDDSNILQDSIQQANQDKITDLPSFKKLAQKLNRG